MTLDDIQPLDTGRMYDLIRQFPDQLRDGRSRAQDVPLPAALDDLDHIVVAGMGGSAIGGDLVRTLVQPTAPVPMTVVRDYTLPAYVGPGTLLVASSFSGNTEETLTVLDEAARRRARILCVTSGGQMLEIARNEGYPVVQIPGGMPPRAALGYSFAAVMTLAERLGLAPADAAAWDEAMALLEAQTAACADPAGNEALDLARTLHGKLPVVYSGPGLMEAVNLRWRGQFQENSKVYATGNLFPEMNHNEIMGWQYPGAVHALLAVVVLRDRGDHPRIRRRLDVTGRLLGDRAASWTEVESRGTAPLARLLSLVNLGDWVSFYLALLQAVDPTPIPLIDALKEAMQA
ncbi:MAG: bifunctional phosphoglucose/phosphomannose isomerase [Bacteroidetes bacterium]|nr:bifunctional phosphoglucose/phosphomannose isomerase [Rhodothermaceae bacterium RA]RMH60166.1 MAG: bifunctional phosphoglucose/phosphomannose isomerase [Bacteroidota bacterium]